MDRLQTANQRLRTDLYRKYANCEDQDQRRTCSEMIRKLYRGDLNRVMEANN